MSLGTTTIRGGVLALRDSGSIASNAAINILHGTLDLNNTGLSSSTTRLNVSRTRSPLPAPKFCLAMAPAASAIEIPGI